MRFNRAAKVAALPLLAMVLVVALIACQAGPAGKDGTGTTGTTGTTGPMGINALNPAAGDPVIFNDKAVDVDFTAGDVRTINLDPYFVGGNRDDGITYTMSPLPLPFGLTAATGVAITENKLVVTPSNDDAAPAPAVAMEYANRHVFIRATDADGRIADNVITIRRNEAPEVESGGTIVAIRIGTQTDAIMADDQGELFGDNLTNWTCSTFNKCTLNLATIITDHMDDMLTYTATPADSDNFSVKPAAMGITLIGKAATKAAVEVTPNAIDTGKLEVLETSRPTFNVIVDAQPVKVKNIEDAVLERYGIGGIQYVGLAATAGLPAFFMDPEEGELTFTFTYDDDTIVHASVEDRDHDGDDPEDANNADATPEVPVIVLRSLNVGTAVVTVRATEEMGGTADNTADDSGVGQYVEGTFTVTVNR